MINIPTPEITILLFVLFLLLTHPKLSNASDTITSNQSITSNNTLISSGQSFELGIFSPGNSQNSYVGIWYKNITPKVVVWVANRETPIKNSASAELKLTQTGLLVILDEANNIIWSSNISRPAQNPVLQLFDSGNLVLREANDDNPENLLWQSFECPTDTYLPSMDFGLNSITGRVNSLTSWKSVNDPSPGEYTFYMDSVRYAQGYTVRKGVTLLRMAPWNGEFFSGTPNPNFRKTGIFKYKGGGFYYREDVIDSSVISRYTINPSGVCQRLTWVSRTQGWVVYLNIPADNCDSYRLCGAYGSCNIGNFPVCGCLNRFVPKDPEGWTRADWSNGCVRRTPLNCSAGDGFLKYSGIKLPDARNSWYNESMTLEECKVKCFRNCSCMGYTNLNISNGGSGCLIWFEDLVDIRVLSAQGQDVYIRMASSELDSNAERLETLILSMTTVGLGLLGLSLVLYIWRRMKNERQRSQIGIHSETHIKDLQLTLLDLFTISKATNNFSIKNKLGEGGYGPVYKGSLKGGQDIAVKRLSKTSKQGLDEFKNEVICIAKLQHRNLVKLLGCCIQGDEKMLIYEYMPNKSLDLVLLDNKTKVFLDWPKRFRIVIGIARGLMYLHQDSRLRIIHRDLKASNILLDSEMNPKISDFGIAKRFRENEIEDKTRRVVGTYGYMSPEYAVHGRFSTKSDVFSFGVLVLEIVSGKRNSSFSHGDRHLTLLGHAWNLYKEGRSIELVDKNVNNMDNLNEVQRLIHVGLLCVQRHPDDRPTMTSVVAMLSNEITLPQANCPGFFTETDMFALEGSNNANSSCNSSTNKVTITMLQGR